MRVWVRFAAIAALAGTALLAGCGSSGSSSGNASIRLLNATAGYAGLDLAVQAVVVNSNVTVGTVGSYATAADTGVSTVVSSTGSTTALSSATRTLTKDMHYLLVAYGSSGALKTAVIQEDVAAPASGLTSLQMLNLAPDAGALDIYLTGSTDSLDGATPMASNVAAGSSVPYNSVNAGTYRLRVTGAGAKTDLRLDVQGVVLGSARVASLVIAEATGTVSPVAGGVLVNAVLVQQQGTAQALGNSQARIRVVSAVTTGSVVTALVGNTTLVDGVTAPDVSAYQLVPAIAGLPVALTVGGVAVPVPNVTLEPGGDYTLLVCCNANALQTTLLADDNRYPTTAGTAKIRLLNGLTGQGLSLTLQANLQAVAQSVPQGEVSPFAVMSASATTLLSVTAAGVAPPASWSITVPVNAKGLYTVYMLGDPSTTAPRPVWDR